MFNLSVQKKSILLNYLTIFIALLYALF